MKNHRQFDEPQAVLNDASMTDAQKKQCLEDWRVDLLECLRATEENMRIPDDRPAPDIAEELRRVTDALASLEGAA
jgi:hypothetical protein